MQVLAEPLEDAVWAAAEGIATDDQIRRLEADPHAWRRTLEVLLDDMEDRLESVRQLNGPERERVVADVTAEHAVLESAYDLLLGSADPARAATLAGDPPGEVRLQASWSSRRVVVWAGGPGTAPADADQLAERLEAVGGPALGWSQHPAIDLPSGGTAAAMGIPVEESLGWLVSVGASRGAAGAGSSVAWLGRVAVAAVRLVARGSIVPSLDTTKRSDGQVDLAVRWRPALLDEVDVDGFAQAMPEAVVVLGRADARAVTLDVLRTVVDAIVRSAAGRLELPAPPPATPNAAAVAEAVTTRVDGSVFTAPASAAGEIAKRLERWSKPVSGTTRPRLVVQLDAPDRDGAWFLHVLGPGADDNLMPIELALGDGKGTKALEAELTRLERILPALMRPGAMRRGQVYLSADEAWDLMSSTGPSIQAAGFEVRLPALSRSKPAPALAMFVEPTGDTVVGANQLNDVRWSAVFGDVELTAEDINRLASEARPLVKSRGRWVELDKVDLKEAAAALAERAGTTQLTGAEVLRHSIGLEGQPLGGGVRVQGGGWANDLFEAARDVDTEAVTTPPGFSGELRSYQAEALGWLGFLDAVGLGGCLALDMGLGKTPVVLAHLARERSSERGGERGGDKSLVIAPPAVVGNWAREAARFTPDLRVIIHHGASRAGAAGFERSIADADVVLTTYATAVRDVEVLGRQSWGHVVLDEAQAIKNPANETSQQLRRLPARTKVALTGTPIENGLGDLWSILDFTNPGLVGERANFVAKLQGTGEAALTALNGILVFRRTKAEPEVAAELPDRIDELAHCAMTEEQIGLYRAVLDRLVADSASEDGDVKQGAILAAITALKQICNHPVAYTDDDGLLAGRSGKLTRLEEIVDSVFAAGERILIFTHFASWGRRLAAHLSETTGVAINCYDGSLARGARDRMTAEFQEGTGPGALVLSLKAGGTGLNLTAASHVVLYDRWWNPAVEDQARDRAWRIGQDKTVVSHRLICPGTIDERVEEVVAGKRHVADLILPGSSSLADLDSDQLRVALGLSTDDLLTEDGASNDGVGGDDHADVAAGGDGATGVPVSEGAR